MCWGDPLSLLHSQVEKEVRFLRIQFTDRQFGWQEWDVNDVGKLGNGNNKQQIVHMELLCSRHGPKGFFIK